MVCEELTSDRTTQDNATSQPTPKRRRAKDPSFNSSSFPSRTASEWKIGPHVSAAGGVENTVINAASIG